MGVIQTISDWDKSAFLFLNGFHTTLLDYLMTIFTFTPTWLIFYGVFLFIIIRKYGRKSIPLIFCLFLIILLSDQIAGVIKHSVMRLRPSNDPSLEGQVHIFFDKGGLYGFISAHAANAFSFATFSMLLFRNKFYTLFIYSWATLIAYTRIYLGLHYPGDILGGVVLGSFVGWGIFRLLLMVEDRFFPVHPFKRNRLNHNEIEPLVITALITVIVNFTTLVLLLQNDVI